MSSFSLPLLNRLQLPVPEPLLDLLNLLAACLLTPLGERAAPLRQQLYAPYDTNTANLRCFRLGKMGRGLFFDLICAIGHHHLGMWLQARTTDRVGRQIVKRACRLKGCHILAHVPAVSLTLEMAVSAPILAQFDPCYVLAWHFRFLALFLKVAFACISRLSDTCICMRGSFLGLDCIQFFFSYHRSESLFFRSGFWIQPSFMTAPPPDGR